MTTDDDTASLGYMWPDATIRAEKPPVPKTWRIPPPPARPETLEEQIAKVDHYWTLAAKGEEMAVLTGEMSTVDADEGVRDLISWTWDRWPEACEAVLFARLRA